MVQYCDTLNVFNELNWAKEQPEFISGSSPVPETVDESGTLGVNSIIYLDHNRIISNTLTLYHGADVNTLTPLVEDTDYSIDLDKAKITILSVATIGADSIFAEYQYVQIDGRPGFSNSFVSSKIDRATSLFDIQMRRSFQPPTIVPKEEQVSKGAYDLKYRAKHLSPVFIKLTLASDITDVATTMVLADTDGLVADEYITIDEEVVKITSVDSATELTIERGLYDTVGLAHVAGAQAINCVLELSQTPIGSVPVYDLMSFISDYDVSYDTGLITLLSTSIPDKNMSNRLRLTYKYGSEDIPLPIVQACVEQVTRWMASAAIAKGLIEGVDGFAPRANEVLSEDIKQILNSYRLFLADSN